MADTADISSLFPGREIVARGETVTLRPFFFGELPVVIRLVHPILSAAGLSQMIRVTKRGEKAFDVKLIIPENFIDLLSQAILEASEPTMELLSFALNKERAWFNEVPIDEGIALTVSWFEVNRDFFVQRVLPILIARGLLKNTSTGTTSSESSSSTDIVETT